MKLKTAQNFSYLFLNDILRRRVIFVWGSMADYNILKIPNIDISYIGNGLDDYYLLRLLDIKLLMPFSAFVQIFLVGEIRDSVHDSFPAFLSEHQFV